MSVVLVKSFRGKYMYTCDDLIRLTMLGQHLAGCVICPQVAVELPPFPRLQEYTQQSSGQWEFAKITPIRINSTKVCLISSEHHAKMNAMKFIGDSTNHKLN